MAVPTDSQVLKDFPVHRVTPAHLVSKDLEVSQDQVELLVQVEPQGHPDNRDLLGDQVL